MSYHGNNARRPCVALEENKMASIGIGTILEILGDAAKKRNDASKWEAKGHNLDTDANTKYTVDRVKMEATTGLEIDLSNNGTTIKLHAKPASLKKTRVFVNGELDPEAGLVFDFKGNFGNPSRWAFDFRPVTVDGEEFRINTRFDP